MYEKKFTENCDNLLEDGGIHCDPAAELLFILCIVSLDFRFSFTVKVSSMCGFVVLDLVSSVQC